MEDSLWFTATAGLIAAVVLFKLLTLRPNAQSARPEAVAMLQEMFPSLSRQSLLMALQDCNWNLEATIDLLTAAATPPLAERAQEPRETQHSPVLRRSVSASSPELASEGWSEDAERRQKILAAKKRMLIENCRKGRQMKE
jgi:hypothetical protein